MKLKDIAKIAGVSPSTISKIVNGKDDGISTETRDRVLQIVRQYHYTPYSGAKAATKSWTLGVLMGAPTSLDTTLEGIVSTAQEEGYVTLVLDSQGDPDQERRNVAALHKHRVDGVIWEPVTDRSLSLLENLEELDVPVLTIGKVGGDESLLLPYEEAGYRLTEDLIRLGHRKVGALISQGRRTERFLTGYRKCLYDYGIPAEDEMVVEDLNDATVAAVADESVSGFVSTHYRKALEFTQLMESLRYRIPEDVSVIALKSDNSQTLDFPGRLEISTYAIRNADFGSYLCEKLINTIEKREGDLHSFVQEFELENTHSIAPPPWTHQRKAIVVGSINLDRILRVPRMPAPGTTINCRISATYAGGKGVNQAVGIARMGHKATLIGNVGLDRDGDEVFRSMEREGVDTSGVERKNAEPTGRSFIYVDRLGESAVTIIPGANDTLSGEDVRERADLFAGARYCLVQTEIPMDAVYAALVVAKERGVKTIMKPASCDELPADLLGMVDILIPNRQELDDIMPGEGSMEEKASSLITLGAGTVIVTLGAQGSYLKTDDEERYFRADHVEAEDTTGACDAFISALTSSLLERVPLVPSIEVATIAAGYSVTQEGVVPSLIDRNSLETRVGKSSPRLFSQLSNRPTHATYQGRTL